MKKAIGTIVAVLFVFLFSISAKADINYNLLYNWSLQPPNVQQDLVNKRTNIQVVDKLPWESPSLYETYAYTTMNVIPGTLYVNSIDIYIKRGYEFALTHEVGHAFSNAGNWVYGWCCTPEFINIWQTERYNNAMMPQGLDDIREYFAEAYDMYIRYPQILKQANPETFNYIKVVMSFT